MNHLQQKKMGKLVKGGSGANFTDDDGGGGGVVEEENVLVAVKASKEIPKAALIWALTHVVQPGDCISLVVVVPPQSSGRRLWVFPRFAGDCASTNKKSTSSSSSSSNTSGVGVGGGGSSTPDQKCEFTDSCSQMILQLHDVYDPNKVNVKIKVVSSSPCGAVAAEAKRVQASWVVLEKDLKNEEKRCMEDLHCNIVAMRRSHPKVLRLNLVGSASSRELLENPESNTTTTTTYSSTKTKQNHHNNNFSTSTSTSTSTSLCPMRGPSVTPSSSPDPFTSTDAGTSSVSSSDLGTSPFFIPETLATTADQSSRKTDESYFIGRKEKERREQLQLLHIPDTTSSVGGGGGLESESDISTPRSTTSSALSRPWLMSDHFKPQQTHNSPAKVLLEKLAKLEKGPYDGPQNYMSETDFLTSMREAMAVPRSGPMGPPPLCSVCQHKAPVFGKPPRQFSYGELDFATRGFSGANFLAEGGFGSVHRGVLPDGQPIAVKQHKLASSQGDVEFCSEVEVLSCAQHRNVVMLIGYCIEDKRRLLVYEYICNGSLDSHLYGRNRDPLEWYARQRIALGAARGLRYLHEECRVGCIIHRDMRPNNILLTHDYEPLVGDFGLARWQPDGDTGVQTRVIGTFGYLAPEYAQSGQITEKTDVYSFGVVLVELLTGRKAVDLSRPKGQQCLTEWARPLLEDYAVEELIDPVLGDRYSEQEVHCMIRAASLCIMRDPHLRPRMSQVLRILEGDVFTESSYMSTPSSSSYDGNRSGRLFQVVDQQQSYSGSLIKEESEVYTFNSARCAQWAREKARARA